MSSEAHHPIFDPIWSSKMANWKFLICTETVYVYIERERKKERCLFSLGISQLAMFDDCCGCCVWNLPKKKSKNIGTEKGAPATQLGWVSQLGLTDQFLWAMASIAIWVKPTAA